MRGAACGPLRGPRGAFPVSRVLSLLEGQDQRGSPHYPALGTFIPPSQFALGGRPAFQMGA